MMKILNTFNAVIVTLTLFGSLNAQAADTAKVEFDSNTLLAAKLQLNAQYSAAALMDENLKQVVATINASVKKELMLSIGDNSSLDGALAKSQSIKDDKVTSAVGE